METLSSGLSLLMALAIAAGLFILARRNSPARHGHGRGRAGGPGAARRRSGSYTTLGYAFSWTFGAALFLVSGLSGYRLDKRHPFFADERWSSDVIWWQVWMGLPFVCLAVYFWRKGLREIRSNVYVPELAGRDAAAPPSRRIERR